MKSDAGLTAAQAQTRCPHQGMRLMSMEIACYSLRDDSFSILCRPAGGGVTQMPAGLLEIVADVTGTTAHS